VAAVTDQNQDGPEVAIIGGSGLYQLFTHAREVHRETPFGEVSDAVTVGELSGRQVAFLPRHGRNHQFPPHGVNYRANVWLLRELGVRRVIAVGAVGSLRADLPPGSLVVPDQLVDRTTGRAQTYFDGPQVAHAPFADPFCPPGRDTALAAARQVEWPPVDGGTQVVIQGPRFSSRAESAWYAAQGWSLVGMTALPEAALARELGLCYIPLCLVTDLDAGVEAGEGVTQEEVMALFAANVDRMRGVLAELVRRLPAAASCECADLAPNPM
jgi:5'-methylthioadenosine phosphorylase